MFLQCFLKNINCLKINKQRFEEKSSIQIHRMQFLMPKVSVEIPQELLDDLNRHVGDDKKFVSQSDAIRTAIRKMLDMMDEIDRRHGRLNQ